TLPVRCGSQKCKSRRWNGLNETTCEADALTAGLAPIDDDARIRAAQAKIDKWMADRTAGRPAPNDPTPTTQNRYTQPCPYCREKDCPDRQDHFDKWQEQRHMERQAVAKREAEAKPIGPALKTNDCPVHGKRCGPDCAIRKSKFGPAQRLMMRE